MMENPFSFCGSACEPRSRPASHDGTRPAARMAVKDARRVRTAERSSAARSLTATAAEGTSTWAGATRFILGRSSPTQGFARVQIDRRAMRNLLFLVYLLDRQGDREGDAYGDLCISCTLHLPALQVAIEALFK